MADIKNEVQSVRNYVGPLLPGAKFHLQYVPAAYVAGELAIEAIPGTSTNETRAHYRLDRLYQLVYFGTSGLDCISKMQILERKFNDEQLISLAGTDRYLRIGSFSLTKPFKTETAGVYAIIGMLSASIREARTQEQYEKVARVGVVTYSDSNVGTWEVIDGSHTPENPIDGFTWNDIESGKTILDKE